MRRAFSPSEGGEPSPASDLPVRQPGQGARRGSGCGSGDPSRQSLNNARVHAASGLLGRQCDDASAAIPRTYVPDRLDKGSSPRAGPDPSASHRAAAQGTFEPHPEPSPQCPPVACPAARQTSSASPSRIQEIVVHGENTNRMSPPISRLPGPSRFQSMWTIPRRTATATASVRSCQSKFQQNAIFISMLQHLMLARTEPLAVTLRRCPILRKALDHRPRHRMKC